MPHPSKLPVRAAWARLIATVLVSTALGFVVPQMAWAQTTGATNQAKAIAEGHRLFNAGTKAYQQGQISEAARFWEQARSICARELGEDHPNTLALMTNLAVTYSDLGHRDKALALMEQTLKLRRAKLGEDHPDTLGSMSNLAKT